MAKYLGRGWHHALGNMLQLRLGEAQVIAQAEAVIVCLQPTQLPHQLVTPQLLHARTDVKVSLKELTIAWAAVHNVCPLRMFIFAMHSHAWK